MKSRIDELLVDVTEKRTVIDDLEAQVGSLSEETESALQDLLQARTAMSEMVSKEQVHL